MRTHVWTVIALLPFMPLTSQAAQNWSYGNAGEQPWVFSSEDTGSPSYLGVDIADVTAERLSALKLKEEKGVEVTMVDQDAPAGKAGIKEHDVILTMNGTTVESGAQLKRMIHETPPGRVVTFGLSRDGQPMTVRVQLADKHKEYGYSYSKPGNFNVHIPEINIPDIDIPSMNMVVVTQSARSGLMIENITPQLGDFFGVKNGNGVLVRSVDKGSRAEKAGFRAGDVIVRVNAQAVHDTSDFSHAVRSRTGDSVTVGVMRDKKEQTLTLSLPSKKESGDLIQEESFEDEPLMRAQSALELSKLRDELASLRPQMELASENSRREMRELRDSLRKQEEEFRKQSEKQREQMRKDMEHLREQWRHWRADWL